MTAPRIRVPGATVALTRRTVLLKAFLGPWHPLVVEQCWLYALADAPSITRCWSSTTITSPEAPVRDFLRRFHRDLSCALHALLCSERYDAPCELFDDRSTHEMRLMDAGAPGSTPSSPAPWRASTATAPSAAGGAARARWARGRGALSVRCGGRSNGRAARGFDEVRRRE